MGRGQVRDVPLCEQVLRTLHKGQGAIPCPPLAPSTDPTTPATSLSPSAGVPSPSQSHSGGVRHGNSCPPCSWPMGVGSGRTCVAVGVHACSLCCPAAAQPLHAPPCIIAPRSHAQGLISVRNKVYICNAQLMVRVINHSSRLTRDMMDFPILTSLNHSQFLLPDLLGLSQKQWAQQCIAKSNLPTNQCHGASPRPHPPHRGVPGLSHQWRRHCGAGEPLPPPGALITSS